MPWSPGHRVPTTGICKRGTWKPPGFQVPSDRYLQLPSGRNLRLLCRMCLQYKVSGLVATLGIHYIKIIAPFP